MRNLRLLDAYRDASPHVLAFYGDAGDHGSGVFRMSAVKDETISAGLPRRCSSNSARCSSGGRGGPVGALPSGIQATAGAGSSLS